MLTILIFFLVLELELIPLTELQTGRAWSQRDTANMALQGDRVIFPCPNCPSTFKYKNNLYYHSKFECGMEPRFNCPYCVYRTKHVSNVRAHIRRKHPGNEVYVVDIFKKSL